EGRLFMLVDELDRVLQRDDVDRLLKIDFVEQGGEGRRFARAGGAGDQHKAGFFLGNFFENVGHLQLVQRRDDGVQLAADDRVIAALREDVDAETGSFGE